MENIISRAMIVNMPCSCEEIMKEPICRAGQYVDIAFVMKNPGSWMLHCHIIDHEDGGMMMRIEAH